MKTGTHPMRTRLRLFLEWGITFGEPYVLPEKAARPVAYADKQDLEQAILQRHPPKEAEEPPPTPDPLNSGGSQREDGQTMPLDKARGVQDIRRKREDRT